MVNSKGKLLTLTLITLTLKRLSVQLSPQLLQQLSSQLAAARCTGKQVLRLFRFTELSERQSTYTQNRLNFVFFGAKLWVYLGLKATNEKLMLKKIHF